jgi:hypothetical protein
MADLLSNTKTTLSNQETVVRAVQFFAREKFRTSSQTDRIATFDGMPPIPWGMLLLTIIAFMACIVPGIIMYFVAIKKIRRFQNLVVTANPIAGGTEVSISHPKWARKHVERFLQILPPLPALPAPPAIT